jgi:iron complex transport system substrate-binding protein
MRLFTVLILSFSIAACTVNKESAINASITDTVSIRYAKGFTVSYKSGVKQIEIKKPYQGAETGYTYWLVPKDQVVPNHNPDVRIIRTPVESIVCTSTTHIPLLDYLDESDKLIGFPTTDYISSEKTRVLIDSGKVTELGVDKGLNIELLATLKPGLVMAYTMGTEYGQFKKIEQLGVPVVLNAEYLEEHPLGRAEWIKYMALFFNKEKEADSVFNVIENNYNRTKALVEKTNGKKPSVMSGIVYGDAWFMPAGQNYAAKLLRDAGYHYLWSNDSTAGFLQLSFESVYEKANQADFWIGVGSFNSLAEIKNADPRYPKFNAFQKGNVYTYNARLGAKGGSEFLELGYLRPDIILNDLVMISYPELLPEHILFFHKKLE